MATAEHSTGSLVAGNARRARTTGALRVEGESVSVWRADRTAPALVVDHPLRDLAGLTFVAAEVALAEGGALLVPMYRQVSLFEWARPRVLLVNYIYPTNHSLRVWAHERGVPVAVLETEGAPYREIKATVASITGDPDFGRVTRFFMWSEAMLNAFREVWPESKPPKFSVTGHPRFDLLEEPLRSQALSSRTSKKVVLFATSFATFNGFANQTPAGVIM
ncbi:MAG TPA: hypothetical protein VG778_02840, partial [Blastocatellia bacterium]|nr:hypothetical protein [Blastocatellia bacterium]